MFQVNIIGRLFMKCEILQSPMISYWSLLFIVIAINYKSPKMLYMLMIYANLLLLIIGRFILRGQCPPNVIFVNPVVSWLCYWYLGNHEVLSCNSSKTFNWATCMPTMAIPYMACPPKIFPRYICPYFW